MSREEQLIENGKISLRLAVWGSWATAITVATACAWMYNIDGKLDALGRSRWTFDMQQAYEWERQKDSYKPIDVVAIHDRHKPE